MSVLTVRNLSESVHRALSARAALHGRSTEAEVCAILEAAVKADEPLGLGSLLADIGRRARLTDEECNTLVQRDPTPARPMDFG